MQQISGLPFLTRTVRLILFTPLSSPAVAQGDDIAAHMELFHAVVQDYETE